MNDIVEHPNLEKKKKKNFFKKHKKHKKKPKKVDIYEKDPINSRIYTHGFYSFYMNFFKAILPDEDWEKKCMDTETRTAI